MRHSQTIFSLIQHNRLLEDDTNVAESVIRIPVSLV